MVVSVLNHSRNVEHTITFVLLIDLLNDFSVICFYTGQSVDRNSEGMPSGIAGLFRLRRMCLGHWQQ